MNISLGTWNVLRKGKVRIVGQGGGGEVGVAGGRRDVVQ